MPELIHLLIYLLVVGVIIALIWYVIGAIPIPDPLGRIIKVVVMVIGCIIVLMMLLQLAGGFPALRM
jgi:hypothetical protein